MKVKIKIKNKEKILRAFNKSPRVVSRRIDKAVKRAGLNINKEVKENITAGTDMWKAPIDTGQMRQGISPTFSPFKATIKPSPITDYAVFVHEGTKFMRERPFFDITVKREKRSIERFFNKELDDAIKDIIR